MYAELRIPDEEVEDPSIAVELREDVALKTGKRSSRWWSSFCSEDFFNGFKYIYITFGLFTVVITIALIVQIYYGDYQVIPSGSAATDSRECSSAGTTILKLGGNAVDAAVTSAFCLAVVNPHTTGLDADGIAMVYSHRTRLSPDVIEFIKPNDNDQNIHFPNLVLGLFMLHEKFGHLPWKTLVQPIADMAKNGFLVPLSLAKAVSNSKFNYFGHIEAGQNLTIPTIGATLQTIADLSDNRLRELLYGREEYIHSTAMRALYNDYNIYTSDNVTLGSFFLQSLGKINQTNFTMSDTTKPEYVYRIAQHIQEIYDLYNFTKYISDETSSNVAVIDKDDLYVSLVTGMHATFGSKEVTADGYVLDTKPSSDQSLKSNLIPLIITDKNYICGRRIILGGGDLSSITQVVMSLLLAGQEVTTSVENPRFKVIDKSYIGIEDLHKPKFSDAVISYIHLLNSGQLVSVPEPYNSCNVVQKTSDTLSSHSDSRGGGIASRF